MTSQVVSGKAFEFGIAAEFARAYGCDIVDDAPFRTARNAFANRPPREKEVIEKTARRSVEFLLLNDENLAPRAGEWRVSLQPDAAGMRGDVRDIVVKTPAGTEAGVSAKNRNDAVKHSRLSDHIDFGEKWAGVPCSASYFDCGSLIYAELRAAQNRGAIWRDIPDKIERFYRPLLRCFKCEFESVCDRQGAPANLLHYLFGRKDFYKVVKVNGQVNLQSFNFGGTLGWGNRIQLSNLRLVEASIRDSAAATMDAIFNSGWNLSFRLHSARTLVEPSLKFDIRLVGHPSRMSTHSIDIDNP